MPVYLYNLYNWIWDKDKDGRINKVPKSAKGGSTGASANLAHTWVTYAEADATKEVRKAEGLAFKIPEGYFFLDANDYPLGDPLVQTLLNRFNSYTEFSVSGGGIHTYGKCDFSKIPSVVNKKGKRKLDSAYYVKHPTNRLELYIGGLTNRFAVYIWNVVWSEPLKECTEQTAKHRARILQDSQVSALPISLSRAKEMDFLTEMIQQTIMLNASALFSEDEYRRRSTTSPNTLNYRKKSTTAWLSSVRE